MNKFSAVIIMIYTRIIIVLVYYCSYWSYRVSGLEDTTIDFNPLCSGPLCTTLRTSVESKNLLLGPLLDFSNPGPAIQPSPLIPPQSCWQYRHFIVQTCWVQQPSLTLPDLSFSFFFIKSTPNTSDLEILKNLEHDGPSFLPPVLLFKVRRSMNISLKSIRRIIRTTVKRSKLRTLRLSFAILA